MNIENETITHPLEEAIHVSEWNEYTKHLEPRILVCVGTINFKTIKQLVTGGYIICDKWHGEFINENDDPITLDQIIERNIYSDFSEFRVDYCDHDLLGAVCFRATDRTGGSIVEYNISQKAKFLKNGAGMVCFFEAMTQKTVEMVTA
jgi:hypothetical protein